MVSRSWLALDLAGTNPAFSLVSFAIGGCAATMDDINNNKVTVSTREFAIVFTDLSLVGFKLRKMFGSPVSY